MDIVPHKRCTKCGVEYPATSEFFCVDKRNKDGITGACRRCINIRQAKWNRDRYPEHKAEYLARSAIWRRNNKDIKRRLDAEYRAKNPHKVRANKQKWHNDNQQLAIQRAKAWKKRNPDKVRASGHTRRARIANAEGKFTSQDVKHQYDSQHGKCWWCGKLLDPNDYHIDHRIPIARGGSNDPRNIVISCPTCNTSRGAKLPHEWNGRLL